MHKKLFAAFGIAALAVSLAGCSGGEASAEETVSLTEAGAGCAGTGITPTVLPDREKILPEGILQAGELKLATDPTLPPYEFIDDQDRLAGLDIELGELIGCALDLEVDYERIDFAGLLTAVQAGRYDFAIAGISDTPERAEVMDLIDYQTEGTAIIVPEDNPADVETIDDLCGMKVAAVQGSVPLELLTRKSESCAEPIEALALPDSNSGFLAVRSGRADAVMETLGTAVWFQESENITGLKALTTELYAQGYQAIAFPKGGDSEVLRDAVQAALASMIEDGSYAELYERWDLAANMVDEITVNDSQRFADKYYNVD